MAPLDLQEQLNRHFQTLTAGVDAATLDIMISDTERIMGEPSRQLLAQVGLLTASATPDNDAAMLVTQQPEPFALLDNACGTGPIANALLTASDAAGVVPRSRVLCADFSEALVGALRQRIAAQGWEGIETAVLDAQETGLPSASFTHITLNFAMHVIPAPERVLADAYRLLRPGGTLGFTVWAVDNAGLASDLGSALAGLPFETPALPDPFPTAVHGKTNWVTEAGLATELGGFRDGEEKGLVDVELRTRTQTVRVDGPEHYLRMYGPMVQWATTSFWDEATRARAREGGLLDRHVVERLREKYGGGGWDQKWTYIVATCRKPL